MFYVIKNTEQRQTIIIGLSICPKRALDKQFSSTKNGKKKEITNEVYNKTAIRVSP